MINYEEIDVECREMVKFFNENELITKFSCQGHNNKDQNQFYIMFSNYIADEDISKFIGKYSDKYNHSPFIGKFVKWIRKMDGDIVRNWMYSVSYGDYEVNQKYAKFDLETMKRVKESNGCKKSK